MFHFNNQWSAPRHFTASKSSLSEIKDCKGKAGIYVIGDAYDSRILYVGKAEGNSEDIYSRLKAHLGGTSTSNAGIADLVEHKQSFTIRWAECTHPQLSESIAIM